MLKTQNVVANLTTDWENIKKSSIIDVANSSGLR